MRISDWSSDVCSSDLAEAHEVARWLRREEVGRAGLDDDAGAERLAGQDVGVEALRPLQPYTRSAAGWPRQELRQVALQGLAHHLPAGAEIALLAVDQRVVVSAGDAKRQGALVFGVGLGAHP